MTETITAKSIFKDEELVTIKTTLPKKVLEEIKQVYETGKRNTVWNLKKEEFLGWMAATGTHFMVKDQGDKVVESMKEGKI